MHENCYGRIQNDITSKVSAIKQQQTPKIITTTSYMSSLQHRVNTYPLNLISSTL